MRPTHTRDLANTKMMLQRRLAGPAIRPRRGFDEEQHRFGEAIAIGADMNRASRRHIPWEGVPACKGRTAHTGRVPRSQADPNGTDAVCPAFPPLEEPCSLGQRGACVRLIVDPDQLQIGIVKEKTSVRSSLTLMDTRWTLGQPKRNELSCLWTITVRAHKYVVKLERHISPVSHVDNRAMPDQ